MNNIESLREELRQVEDLLAPLNLRKSALITAIQSLTSGFSVGDIVAWGSHNSTRRGRIVGFVRWCGDRCGLVVEPIRKDGSAGKVVKLYPYHNAVRETAA